MAGAVPFFSGSRGLAQDWPILSRRLHAVVERGRFTHDEQARELEQAIAAYTGARHTIAVGNGTDALVILLRAAGIGAGDEVIVPAYSFFATASCVVHAGATPVFVDVLPGSYAMDPALVRRAVTARTRAIMPVHLFSQMADMAPLRELAHELGLLLLEDSAEGIGMRSAGRHAGLCGDGGVLSFFPTKTLGALGDAGMILTDDDAIAERARRLRMHGQRVPGSYRHEEVGYNSRCDEIQAAVLLTRLTHLERDIEHRARLAQRYTDNLANVPGLDTPWVRPTHESQEGVWYVYLVESDHRDELARHLAERGIGTEAYYPRPLPDQPALRRFAPDGAEVPVAREASRRALGLPLYADLRLDQVDHVSRVVADFHHERSCSETIVREAS